MSNVVFVKHPFSTLPSDIPIVTVDPSDPMPTFCLIVRTSTHDVLINFQTGAVARTRRVSPPEPILQPRSDRSFLYTWNEFAENVKDGILDDSDGSGVLGTATHVSDIEVSPSQFHQVERFAWATHVHWYNR